MINNKMLKDNEVIDNLKRRGFILNENYFELEEQKKVIQKNIEEINHRLNNRMGNNEDKTKLKEYKMQFDDICIKINEILYLIPNVIHQTVPNGKGEEDNIVIKTIYDEKKQINKNNYIKNAQNYGLDLNTGVDLAQARFNVMRGDCAKLHRKLLNDALDFYNILGYEEFYVPNLVNENTIFGTGQYPKFKEELFTTEGNQKLFLIPTGEVPLTNIYKNKILKINEVENKMMTHTPCFRKEAGAYGKDTKGIIRQHQFEKVELVRTCLPENGLINFEEMINDVENFVRKFNIPYRIIELCAGDIGFAGHKAYDFEIWFPNENKYREIATITWCTDFQARRMNTRYKNKDNKNEYIHTLNGTGLAVGRVLAAIFENYDNEEIKDLFI